MMTRADHRRQQEQSPIATAPRTSVEQAAAFRCLASYFSGWKSTPEFRHENRGRVYCKDFKTIVDERRGNGHSRAAADVNHGASDGNCFAHRRTTSAPTFDRALMNSCATSFQP
jgi:hypothetical protein